jgi:hypothetical protein
LRKNATLISAPEIPSSHALAPEPPDTGLGDDDPTGAAQLGSGNICDDESARAADRDLSGDRTSQCSKDEVVDAHCRRKPYAAGGGERGVDDRGFRQYQIHAAQDAALIWIVSDRVTT